VFVHKSVLHNKVKGKVLAMIQFLFQFKIISLFSSSLSLLRCLLTDCRHHRWSQMWGVMIRIFSLKWKNNMKSKYFKKETVIQFKTPSVTIGLSQLIVFQNLFMKIYGQGNGPHLDRVGWLDNLILRIPFFLIELHNLPWRLLAIKDWKPEILGQNYKNTAMIENFDLLRTFYLALFGIF